MKLVIDISEEDYNNIEPFLNGETIKGGFNLFKALEIIKNGKPLPKGHGRLIDADAFKKNVCTYQQTGCGDCKHSLCCPEDAPTIIEAESEE